MLKIGQKDNKNRTWIQALTSLFFKGERKRKRKKAIGPRMAPGLVITIYEIR